MGIQFTADQVITMAPDASSLSAGKKLAVAKHWKSLGQSAEALWGECQGSALYQVRVDLATLALQCSCPSRKQPCKHGLGLLLLTVNTPDAVSESEPPDWIVAWLNKRATVSQRKETRESQKNTGTPSTAQIKTAEKRLTQVTAGIDQLDLWLNDLVRNGLGSLETQPSTFWEQQASQMVNAQAPGLATRIRSMAGIPNASPLWPEKLLSHLGQLALLTQAFRRIDQLDTALQEDIRMLIGWTLKEEEVIARGERVKDTWLFLGQVTEERERGRAQRIWLLGASTRKVAQVWQFAIATPSFEMTYPLGICQAADLVYWPGASAQRALIENRLGDVMPLKEQLPGFATIDAFLEHVTSALAQNPWQDLFLCTLNKVIPVYDPTNEQWYIRDKDGQALPLIKSEHWQLLALSGSLSIDFVAEWNGEVLLPLGIQVEGKYHILGAR